MLLTIEMYKVSDEFNKLEKNLQNPITLSGTLNTPLDLLRPQIKITSKEMIDYNYAFIPSLNRYYFVNDMTVTRDGYYMVSFTLDVLQTYADVIKNSKATTVESESNNPYYEGYELPSEVRTVIENKTFTSPFTEDGQNILIVANGS